MKTEIVKKDNAVPFDEFVAGHKNGHFLQTSLWGKVKDDWDWFGVICRNDTGKITGTLGVLVRKLTGFPYTMFYAPRGPVCDFDDGETFKTLIEEAKAQGKKRNAYLFKMDKDVNVENEDFRKLLDENKFNIKPRTLDFEDFQCRFVFRLNIEGKTEDEVFASFHSKHRYNVRVALKHNVEIKICGSEEAGTFYEIMQETGERDNFAIRSKEYFAKILDTFGEDARLYMAYYEGESIAGTLCVRWGNKVWYFYGGSLSKHRRVMPNYLLQWEMVRWAIESGCDIYDFRGVSGDLDENNPLYGLYRFKKGFNGEFIEFMGESDLILKPAAEKIVRVSQKILNEIK